MVWEIVCPHLALSDSGGLDWIPIQPIEVLGGYRVLCQPCCCPPHHLLMWQQRDVGLVLPAVMFGTLPRRLQYRCKATSPRSGANKPAIIQARGSHNIYHTDMIYCCCRFSSIAQLRAFPFRPQNHCGKFQRKYRACRALPLSMLFGRFPWHTPSIHELTGKYGIYYFGEHWRVLSSVSL